MRVNLRVYIKRDVYRKRWVPGGIATAVTEDTLISESKYIYILLFNILFFKAFI